MTPEDIFDQRTKRLGGRFPRAAEPDQVTAVLRDIQDRAQDLISAARRDLPALPEIHFDFILNSQVNAVAFKESGRYFIGFNAGTLALLRQLIGRLLADGRIFPDIGNAGGERSDLEPLAVLAPDAMVMLREAGLLRPADPVRQQYAEFLEDQATMFLVGHELVHIVHGHVDYLNAKRQMQITTELEPSPGSHLIERQALEQDADTRSIFSRIDSLRFTFANPNRVIARWRPDAAHPLDLLRDWAISVNLIFRLFGDIRFNGVPLDAMPYPPMALRRAMCDAMALAAFQQTFGAEYAQPARDALLLARHDTDLAFATLLGTEMTSEAISPEYARTIDTHAERLIAYFMDELVPELRPFAHVGL
jgi:hypothetical protein